MIRRRFADRALLGLAPREFALLRGLSSPERIQRFLYSLKQNFEVHGDTCRSVRRVLATGEAHCIEGAFVAAAALWVHGEPPRLMDLRAERDVDHVVALFRRRGCWGALSKTNGPGLRWRDPVYRSLRELAMSYFHEYCNQRQLKTLREYSVAFDLRRLPVALWVTGQEEAWAVGEALDAARHYRLIDRAQAKLVRRRDPFERRIGALAQYREPKAPGRKAGRHA